MVAILSSSPAAVPHFERPPATPAALLSAEFRGELNGLQWRPPAAYPTPDTLQLAQMARLALNYLNGNPDPHRDYECKFSIGPLGIPAVVPLLASDDKAFDPISVGDTDCRMDWQYGHMRQIAGIAQAGEVERGVHARVLSYQGVDHLAWVTPGAWIGPIASPQAVAARGQKFAFVWASGKLMWGLCEEYAHATRAPAKAHARIEARAIFKSLQRLVSWDNSDSKVPRAFLPFGASPWRDGQWLSLRDAPESSGWGAELAHGYPFITEPLVHLYETTGDDEALQLARAVAEGHLHGSQPDMGSQRINPETGEFQKHVHLHTHEIWGVAHLGRVLNEPRYLDWAQRAYNFVKSKGTDYGWYPEYIPQHDYRAEMCAIGDMTSIAAELARSGRPRFWDDVERGVRNTVRASQFELTPRFLALFEELHKDNSPSEIEAALGQLRKLEGGFVAQPSLNDWVAFPGQMGHAGLYENGIQMMGCCPPEGMRALWEAWNGIVEDKPQGVFVNIALSREHPAAAVKAFHPGDGRLEVTAHKAATYYLRAPAWAPHEDVSVTRDGKPVEVCWGGPEKAYLRFDNVHPLEKLVLEYAVPTFTQKFVPQSVPGREEPIHVKWCGNEVVGIAPQGKYLPLFGEMAR